MLLSLAASNSKIILDIGQLKAIPEIIVDSEGHTLDLLPFHQLEL
jgi:hypothetical protein